MSGQPPLTPRERKLAFLRIGLGTAQIMGATVSLILLLQTGTSGLSVGAVVLTGLITVVSMLLFRKQDAN